MQRATRLSRGKHKCSTCHLKSSNSVPEQIRPVSLHVYSMYLSACIIKLGAAHLTDRSSDNCLPCWDGNIPNRSQSVSYMNPRLKGDLDKIWRPSQSPQDWRHENVAPKTCATSLSPAHTHSHALTHTRPLSLSPSLFFLLCIKPNKKVAQEDVQSLYPSYSYFATNCTVMRWYITSL